MLRREKGANTYSNTTTAFGLRSSLRLPNLQQPHLVFDAFGIHQSVTLRYSEGSALLQEEMLRRTSA